MNFSKKNHELIIKNENHVSKTQKHHLNDKLQKSSVLFLQLGLVLALFFVYTALEFESIKKEFGEPPTVMIEPEPIPVTDFDFTIERKVKKIIEKKQQPQTKPTEEFKKVDNNTPEVIDILTPQDSEEPTIDKQIEGLPDGDTDIEDIPTDIDFKIIEDAPIFPGCEGLDKNASKACFAKEVSKFVNKKFNTGIADNLNTHGKQKIWVEFKVDKTGMITDIRARAPHKKLEKEAIRVVKKLPQMTPGKQRNNPVNVKYTLPIVFHVY